MNEGAAMLLEKWYFDFQNADTLGYYYAGRITIAGISVSFTELHHHGSPAVITEHLTSFGHQRSFRSRASSLYEVKLGTRHVDLGISHSRGTLRGRWKSGRAPLRPPVKPLFQNSAGRCSWRIWSPFAEVQLQNSGETPFDLSGAGYIDFVCLSLPVWNLPFRVLYWGRLFSETGWICLLHLSAPGYNIGLMAGRNGWEQHVSVRPIRNEKGTTVAYEWKIGAGRARWHVIDQLHEGPVLDGSRMGGVPRALCRRLDSAGIEKKYRVRGEFENKIYTGIMEEVRWHGYKSDLYM